ncbi:MAG: phosphatidylserine decarboxylase [Limisphaerales bacterium]
MKKLLLLQVVVCAVAWLVGRWFGLALWQIALFLWVPIFVAGRVWFWWFRNVYFFRDPARRIPEGENLILSPADGRVMYVYPVRAGEVVCDKLGRKIPVRELAKTDVGDAPGWLLGIYMTPFDVHFNRAPMTGEITTLHYHQTGVNLPMVDLWEYINFTFLRRAVNLFAARFHLENERMTMRIRNGDRTCFLILIADQFVNKITRFFTEGQTVKAGDKISFIERGSQTDVFLPHEDVTFQVRPGQQVYAGKTILATWNPAARRPAPAAATPAVGASC